ncbi:MAG TPA: hypothetical protein VFV71_11855 [Burkholderiales bacterium]|nr:hypothetical protein [Burkholderiales bacterium]
MKSVTPRRRGRPSTGKALTAAERMRRYRARHRAAGMRAVTRIEPRSLSLPAGALRHRILDARSLAMHCLAAANIEKDRRLLGRVKRTFRGWLERYGDDVPPALAEWKAILDRPWREIAAVITDAGERADRLRQSSPFSTALSPGQRQRVYDAFRS